MTSLPVDVPAESPFEIEVAWEHAQYPAGSDSRVRALLRLEHNPQTATEPVRTESHLVMVLDISGSMNEPKKYPLLREALGLLMRHLEDGLFLTVILFSSNSEVLCEALPAAEARRRVEDLIAALDRSEIRFQGTDLAPALDLAVRSVRKFRRRRPEAVPRIYILTDGQLGDPQESCARTPELAATKAEVSSFGFGDDFAFASMKQVMGRCSGGLIKQIRNTNDILERFRRIVQVTARIVACDAQLELRFAPGVIPGDFFCHRPAGRIWPASEFQPPGSPGFDLGNLEAQRQYVWALEARLPAGVSPGFRLADLRLRFRRLGRGGEVVFPLAVPLGQGAAPGAADPEVTRVFCSLEDLRDASPEAQIAAYRARIEICRAEGRDPEYLAALEAVLCALEAGKAKGDLPSKLVQEADSDPCTTIESD